MGRKKKRQETTSLSSSSSFRSSSYRQEHVSPAVSTTAANNQKTANIGCMSGIFHIMSKYHTRRKFLTFGRKQERNAMVQPPPSLPPQENQPPKPKNTLTRHPHDHGSSMGRLSFDHGPQSPEIQPEAHRSSTDNKSPRVVQRLMGLDEFPVTYPSPTPPSRAVSTAAEKRRKLLGALEKCDEDLKALKMIIETVRAAQTPPRVVAMERREEVEEGESEVGSEGPSPVSVLDHHHLSPGYSKRILNKDQDFRQHKVIKQQKQQITKKKPGDHEDKAINFFNKPPSLPSIVLATTTSQPLHLPATRSSQSSQTPVNTTTLPLVVVPPWSTAMKESVIEVCRDVEWGQTQEIGRIALLLQDFIFRDLIDEITKDLMGSKVHVYNSNFNLPFESCKRKICL